jgi:hypothetical protein
VTKLLVHRSVLEVAALLQTIQTLATFFSASSSDPLAFTPQVPFGRTARIT